jgi:hypothetical protein
VTQSTSQPVKVVHDSDPGSPSRIIISTGIVNSSRTIVTTLAGVRIASGPNR